MQRTCFAYYYGTLVSVVGVTIPRTPAPSSLSSETPPDPLPRLSRMLNRATFGSCCGARRFPRRGVRQAQRHNRLRASHYHTVFQKLLKWYTTIIHPHHNRNTVQQKYHMSYHTYTKPCERSVIGLKRGKCKAWAVYIDCVLVNGGKSISSPKRKKSN